MTHLDESADLKRRFGGLERLYGIDGAANIRAAHVAVVGIGGVGSWAAEALARSAVGEITLVDLDHIAESNINRQVHALDATLGQAKVAAMRDRIAQINPGCIVHEVDEFATPGNWPALLPAGVTVVIDACDDVKTKVAIAAWALETKTLSIACGAAGGKRLAHQVDVDDLARTTHDPLLAQVRYRMRKFHGGAKEGKAMGIACVFSREAVAPPDPSCAIDAGGDGSLNCHGYGSVVTVTATFGQCAAGWLLDRIAARKRPSRTI